MNSSNWFPSIERACSHWGDATMLQQTFESMIKSFEDNNDATIDAAKCLVEVVCRIIVEDFHCDEEPFRPETETPSLGDWLSAAVRALRLGEIRDDKFRKLVSQHHKLAETLNDLRNKGGPVSHGKDGYLNRLSEHHRRSAVLAADAIVAFLFNSFIEHESLKLSSTREPYERFKEWNDTIDQHVYIASATPNDDGWLSVEVGLPDGSTIPLAIAPSQLLYGVDREAYKAALTASQSTVLGSASEEVTR